MSDTKNQDAPETQLPNEPGATLPVPQASNDAAPSDKEVDKSEAKLTKLRQDVIDAQRKVDDGNKSKEQAALEDAQSKLDDAQAAHVELTNAANTASPMTVAQAKVLAVVDGDTSAGDHRAQKFGNDPANPKLAPGVDVANLVKLSRKTPDIVGDGYAYTEVPKEMVGDYERAGWNRA